MGIDLQDQIVVLDEAHNIEDFSRDAASFKVTLEELKTASEEMGKMGGWIQFWYCVHEVLYSWLLLGHIHMSLWLQVDSFIYIICAWMMIE